MTRPMEAAIAAGVLRQQQADRLPVGREAVMLIEFQKLRGGVMCVVTGSISGFHPKYPHRLDMHTVIYSISGGQVEVEEGYETVKKMVMSSMERKGAD